MKDSDDGIKRKEKYLFFNYCPACVKKTRAIFDVIGREKNIWFHCIICGKVNKKPFNGKKGINWMGVDSDDKDRY